MEVRVTTIADPEHDFWTGNCLGEGVHTSTDDCWVLEGALGEEPGVLVIADDCITNKESQEILSLRVDRGTALFMTNEPSVTAFMAPVIDSSLPFLYFLGWLHSSLSFWPFFFGFLRPIALLTRFEIPSTAEYFCILPYTT